MNVNQEILKTLKAYEGSLNIDLELDTNEAMHLCADLGAIFNEILKEITDKIEEQIVFIENQVKHIKERGEKPSFDLESQIAKFEQLKQWIIKYVGKKEIKS